eukprot:m.50612 g.50612  ORF g.50612 m.50612 type:complete len:746 (-) comp7251_c0_seq3:89-2326(-)
MRCISTVHVPSQVRLFSSSTNGELNLPSDPSTWTVNQVQQWFEAHKDGKWAQHADKFAGLTGEEVCDMTNEDFISRIPGFTGCVIFNDVQKLVKQGKYVADVAGKNVSLFPYGESNFPSIVSSGSFYVDKTRFLRAWETEADKVIFLRPPRSGKSLWLNTMESYYDINAQPFFEQWFGNLDIGRNPTDKRNSYHVINFNFGDLVATDNVEQTFTNIVNDSARQFIKAYGLSVEMHAHDGVSTFKRIADAMIDRPFMVLIDEYDRYAVQLLATEEDPTSPTSANAQQMGQVKGMTSPVGPVLRLLAAIKGVDNRAPFRVFVTGVLEMPLAEWGSNDLRNLTNQPAFAELCHLREEDVVRGLDAAGFGAADGKDSSHRRGMLLDFTRAFFNGYRFKGSDNALYNPQLVMGFLHDAMTQPELVERIVSGEWDRRLVNEVDDKNVQLSTTNFSICRHSPLLLPTVLALLDCNDAGVPCARPTAVKAIDLVRASDNRVLLELMRQMGMVTFATDEHGATDDTHVVIPNRMARVHFAEQLLDTVRGCTDDVADFLHYPSADTLNRAVDELSEAIWRTTSLSASEQHFQAALVVGFWVLAKGNLAVLECEAPFTTGTVGCPPYADIIVRTTSATLIIEVKRVRGSHLEALLGNTTLSGTEKKKRLLRQTAVSLVTAAENAGALQDLPVVDCYNVTGTVGDVVNDAHKQVCGYVKKEEKTRGLQKPVRGFVVVQVVNPVIVEEATLGPPASTH